MPFVTEEVWSWWQEGSVHRAPWPSADLDPAGSLSGGGAVGGAGDPAVFQIAAAVLGQVRKAKTAAKVSSRAEAARVVVRGADAGAARAFADDLRAAGNIARLTFAYTPDGNVTTEVTLADPVSPE